MKYLVLLISLLLFGCSAKPKYKVGDCGWHTYITGRMYFKIVRIRDNYKDPFYSAEILGSNDFINLNVSYLDAFHGSVSHEDKCRHLISQYRAKQRYYKQAWQNANKKRKMKGLSPFISVAAYKYDLAKRKGMCPRLLRY